MNNPIPSKRRLAFLYWTVLCLFVLLGVSSLLPPSRQSLYADTDFSADRAFAHIELFSQVPHPMGSPEIIDVRNDIVAQCTALGLVADIQYSTAPDFFHDYFQEVEIANVIVRIPGAASSGAIALVGHFDTVPTTPGANDDGSALAVMLETARAILAGAPLRNDVLLVFIGSEEPSPRFGASDFIAEHPLAKEIAFAINLEAIGSGGAPLVVGMNGPGGWVVEQFRDAAPYPVAFSFLTNLAELIGGSNTDFSEFKEAGIAGIEFAYVHGSTIYHTAEDIPENVSLRTLQQEGDNVLSLARHFGNLDFRTVPDSPEYLFFNMGRSWIASYPAGWSLPLSFLGGLLLMASVLRTEGKRKILRSFALTAAVFLITVLIAIGLWTGIAGMRSQMGIAESYAYLALLLGISLAVCLLVSKLGRKRMPGNTDALGVLWFWWCFGLLTAIAAPGFSYLFLWPVLAGGVAVFFLSFKAVNSWQLGFVVLPAAGAAVLLMAPAMDIFFQFAQPRPGNPDSQILFIVAVPIGLFALVAELVRTLHPGYFLQASSSM